MTPARKPRRKPVQCEKALQWNVCQFLKAALPDDATYLVLPGGAGSRTKAPGYRSGTPDLMVIYHGLAYFIELKAGRGKLSPEQSVLARKLADCGAQFWVATSIDDVEAGCHHFGIPLRARVMAGGGWRAA